MAQKTRAELLTQKQTIKTETVANANSATRIGQMHEDEIDSAFIKSDDAYTAPFPQVTATGTDTYAATLAPAITAYATGQKFQIKFTNASSGVSTLNLNAVGAKKIFVNPTTQATTGHIVAGQISLLAYDAALDSAVGGFLMIGAPTVGGGPTSGSGTTVVGTAVNLGGGLTADADIITNGFSVFVEGTGTDIPQLGTRAPAGIRQAWTMQRGSLPAWEWHLETGADADLHLEAFDDAGTFAFHAIGVDRSTGRVTFPVTVAAPGTNTNEAATTAFVQQEIAAKTIGVQDLFIPASAMWPRVTGGCALLSQVEMATSLFNVQVLAFDQTTQEFAQFQIVPPRKWNNGTITVVPYWTAQSGSGTVQWGISGGAYRNDDALTVAFGSAQTSDDTLLAANDLHIGPATSAITLAGTVQDADFIGIQISRNPASDTLSGDALLLGISVRFTTDAAIDA